MSFFLIRNSRYFGELHQYLTIDPIFPDEKVTPKYISATDSTPFTQRNKRLWLLLQQEKVNILLKNSLLGLDENALLMKKKKNYEDSYNRLDGIERPLTMDDAFDTSQIDPSTGMSFGMGFDDVVKSVRDKKLSESSQDRLRDIWMELGFYSIDEVIKASGSIKMRESSKKINRKLYTSRHLIDPSPYKHVYNEFDPKSRYSPTKEPEFFSHSTDDIPSEDNTETANKLVMNKFEQKIYEIENHEQIKFKNLFNDNKSDSSDNSEKDEGGGKGKIGAGKPKVRDESFDPIGYGSPLLSRYALKKLNNGDFNLVKNNLKKASMETSHRLKEKKKLFKTFSAKDFLKKFDLEFDIKTKCGMVLSFAELITEVEEIMRKNKELNVLNKADEYKKNFQFEPKYLDKNIKVQDYGFSFMPKADEATYPGFITGKYDFRNNPRTMLTLDESVKHIERQGYKPDVTSLSRKAYSLLKKDPNYKHYLDNHIKYWYESIKHVNFSHGLDKDSTIAPVVPWEYLRVNLPKSTKLPPDNTIKYDEEGYVRGRGKKKRAHALAFIRPGTGKITINGKNIIEYCPDIVSRDRIVRPMHITRLSGRYDIKGIVHGGGYMGQNYALRLAISRALCRLIPETKHILREDDLLLVDPRQVERKKTSKHKASKSYTYVKR